VTGVRQPVVPRTSATTAVTASATGTIVVGPGPAVPQLDLTVGEGLADDEDARDADELGVLERHAR
jgi:hypothetical protein